MPDPKKPASTFDPAPPAGPEPVPSRRRLLQGGLGAAPVLMTLVSRPVLAQHLCTTPSGFVSINASTAGRGVTCMGHIPSYWAGPQNFSQWPAGFNPQNPNVTRFGGPQGVFSISPYPSGTTLLDVVSGSANSGNMARDKVARMIVAALLNSAAGLTPPLSVQNVKEMWNEFGRSGYLSFSPQSGASWNIDEIVDYLSTTM